MSSILSVDKIDRLGSRLATLVSSASEKVKTAAERTLSKESPLERHLREALSDKNWGCANSVLGEIARASYNYSDFSVISKSLWDALAEPPKKWRRIFKGLSLLEYLLKNGESGFAAQAREKSYLLRMLSSFSVVEEGRDKGAGIREKAELCVSLAFDAEALKEARAVAARNRDKFVGLSSASCNALGGSSRRSVASSSFGSNGGGGDSAEGKSSSLSSSSNSFGKNRSGVSQSPQRSTSLSTSEARQSESADGRSRKTEDNSKGKNRGGAKGGSSTKEANATQFSDLLGLDEDEPPRVASPPPAVGLSSASNLPASLEDAFGGNPQWIQPSISVSPAAPSSSSSIFNIPPPPEPAPASVSLSTPTVDLAPAFEAESSQDDIFGGFQSPPAPSQLNVAVAPQGGAGMGAAEAFGSLEKQLASLGLNAQMDFSSQSTNTCTLQPQLNCSSKTSAFAAFPPTSSVGNAAWPQTSALDNRSANISARRAAPPQQQTGAGFFAGSANGGVLL